MNPSDIRQCLGRVFRVGQTVVVIETTEEQIVHRVKSRMLALSQSEGTGISMDFETLDKEQIDGINKA